MTSFKKSIVQLLHEQLAEQDATNHSLKRELAAAKERLKLYTPTTTSSAKKQAQEDDTGMVRLWLTRLILSFDKMQNAPKLIETYRIGLKEAENKGAIPQTLDLALIKFKSPAKLRVSQAVPGQEAFIAEEKAIHLQSYLQQLRLHLRHETAVLEFNTENYRKTIREVESAYNIKTAKKFKRACKQHFYKMQKTKQKPYIIKFCFPTNK